MKKALMMGVSGAAMLVAVSAQASGIVAQDQDFEVINSQHQKQAGSLYTRGGEGGSSKSFGAGGDAGSPSNSHGYKNSHGGGSGGDGGMAGSKSYGGDGGMAKAKGYQKQGQDQYVAGSQSQYVQLPDIVNNVDVTVPGASPGSGGAAGPGSGSGANDIEGDDNEVQRTQGNGPSNVASFGGIAVRDNTGDVQIGDGINVTMRNNTEMDATNSLGDIELNGGNSNGGEATGGNLNPDQTSVNANIGRAGDAESRNGPITTGAGGEGGNGTAVSANLGLQGAWSETESEGGDGSAYSGAAAKSGAAAFGKAGSGALAGNLGAAKNKSASSAGSSPSKWSHGHSRNGSSSGPTKSNSYGKATVEQDAGAWSEAVAMPVAKSHSNAQSAAAGEGGAGGDVMSKTGNSAKQAAHSMAAGGDGGDSGGVDAVAKAMGGDNAQMAASHQTLNAATGATQGGAGGNSSVTFGTGAIGAISLGTVSGIATVAQNSGLSANQFTSFSINANTNF